ncbi:fimbrial protein [Pseudomonas aeruginosa]|nr:fimbrial protein [Pseudomonas aeruginosa]
MNHMILLSSALALGVSLGFPASAQATCYRVTSVGSETTTSTTQIRPGEGTAGSWTGACDTCNGSLGLPSVVNVSDESFQPYPTLIASAVAPLTQYGATGGYDPERVFFRCSAGDAVYEMFSTNGDDLYSGYYTGADTVGNDIGLQDAYRTAWPNVLLRLTNVETGETITPIWKERQLSGLDIDSRGFQLVKAKNLAVVRAELYSAPLEAIRYYSPTILSQPYSYTQPAAYIAIKGPGLTAPTVGQAHVGGNWGGWYSNWPGAIGLYRYVTLKRYPTCAVMTVTPHVQFPPITLAEIDSGGVREAPFELTFKCQSGMTNGTGAGATALGIRVSSGALAASPALGLVNASGGLSYLLSDRYGEPGIARGVGIRIYRDGTPMTLLANENSAGGSNAEATGWYPAIGGATQANGGSGGIDLYRETFRARLEKLALGSQPGVTAGRVEATAQVVIRVQ